VTNRGRKGMRPCAREDLVPVVLLKPEPSGTFPPVDAPLLIANGSSSFYIVRGTGKERVRALSACDRLVRRLFFINRFSRRDKSVIAQSGSRKRQILGNVICGHGVYGNLVIVCKGYCERRDQVSFASLLVQVTGLVVFGTNSCPLSNVGSDAVIWHAAVPVKSSLKFPPRSAWLRTVSCGKICPLSDGLPDTPGEKVLSLMIGALPWPEDIAFEGGALCQEEVRALRTSLRKNSNALSIANCFVPDLITW